VLVKDHYLRDEGVDVPNMNQVMPGNERGEVLIEIAAIVRLVIAFGKKF